MKAMVQNCCGSPDVLDLAQAGRHDLVLDNVGNRSFSDWRRILAREGKVLPNTEHAGMSYVLEAYVRSVYQRRQGRPFLALPRYDDLMELRELIEAGRVRPVVEQSYPLEQTPVALARLGRGHVHGKLVIRVVREQA